MYQPLQPGDRIKHPAYGWGEVVRLIRGGRYLLARFEGRRVLVQVAPGEVARAGPVELRRNGSSPWGSFVPSRPLEAAAPTEVSVQSLLPEGEAGDHLALQVLEALRVGVAPGHGPTGR